MSAPPQTVEVPSLQQRAARAVAWTVLRQGLDEGLRLLVFLLLARLLAPAVYGQMAWIAVALALGNLLMVAGNSRRSRNWLRASRRDTRTQPFGCNVAWPRWRPR